MPKQFDDGGLNPGYWTPECERWYQKRVTDINNGKGHPVRAADWQNMVKFDRKALKQVKAKNKAFSLAMLTGVHV